MVERVYIYTTPFCAYCVRAKALLKHRAIPFTEVDVGRDATLRTWMEQASRRRTVPELFIDGVPIGGFDELAVLDRTGKLQALLQAPAPEPYLVPHEAAG
jgi:glutaredoxin 3